MEVSMLDRKMGEVVTPASLLSEMREKKLEVAMDRP